MGSPNVQHIELQESDESSETAGESVVKQDMSLIGNVTITLSATIGEARISVDELFALRKGSTVKLEQDVDDPLTLFLDGKPVAHGHLVAVDDNFGVQITAILAD